MSMSEYMRKWHVKRVLSVPDGTKVDHVFEFEPNGTALKVRVIVTGPNPRPDWSTPDISYKRLGGSIRGTVRIDGSLYSVYVRRSFLWGGVRCYYHHEADRKLRRPLRWLLPAGFAKHFLKLPAFLAVVILTHNGYWHAPD